MTDGIRVSLFQMPTKIVETPDYKALADHMVKHNQVVMQITSEEARAADMGVQRVLPGKGLSFRNLDRIGRASHLVTQVKQNWLVSLVNKDRKRAPSETLPSIEELEGKSR